MEGATVWDIKNPDKKPVSSDMKFKVAPRAPQSQKNPALAFSLSMLVPGAGQLYNREWKLGLLFTLFTLNCLINVLIIFIYWRQTVASFIANNFSTFMTFMGGSLFYLAGVVFWIFTAVHAYYKAAKTRSDRYPGTEIVSLPPVASSLAPGWGQFLNGQTKKGIFYLFFTAAGFFVFPFLVVFPALWPTLTSITQRLIVEWILVVALLAAPLVLFVWLVSVFDALKVALDDIKKEPLRKKIGYAVNRVRMQGVLRGLMPHARLTLALSLALAITMVLGYSLFPKKYYTDVLRHAHVSLVNQEMVVIPSLTGRLLKVTRLEDRGPSQTPDQSRLDI